MKTAIIVMTHGLFGEELISSGELILGKLKDIYSISLEAEKDPLELMNELRTVLDGGFDQYVILTDLFGGTPCNIAASFALEENVTVLSGVNLPMLIEVEMARMQGNYIELSEKVQISAKEGIRDVKKIMQERKAEKC